AIVQGRRPGRDRRRCHGERCAVAGREPKERGQFQPMNIANILKLRDFDTPTVANGVELLRMRDPSGGYTGPDVRALMPDLGVRVGMAVTARMDTTSPGVDNPPSLFRDWLQLMSEAAMSGLPVFAVMESVGPRPRHT